MHNMIRCLSEVWKVSQILWISVLTPLWLHLKSSWGVYKLWGTLRSSLWVWENLVFWSKRGRCLAYAMDVEALYWCTWTFLCSMLLSSSGIGCISWSSLLCVWYSSPKRHIYTPFEGIIEFLGGHCESCPGIFVVMSLVWWFFGFLSKYHCRCSIHPCNSNSHAEFDVSVYVVWAIHLKLSWPRLVVPDQMLFLTAICRHPLPPWWPWLCWLDV